MGPSRSKAEVAGGWSELRMVRGAECSGPGAAHVDVAEAGPGADLDGVLGLLRGLGGGECVAYLPVIGADVEPGGGAFADADLDGAVGGLQLDGAAGDFTHAQGAVGGG